MYAIVESIVAAMGTGGLGCRPRWVVEVQFAGRLNEQAGRCLNAGRVLEGAGYSLEHCGRRRDGGEAVKVVEAKLGLWEGVVRRRVLRGRWTVQDVRSNVLGRWGLGVG